MISLDIRLLLGLFLFALLFLRPGPAGRNPGWF